MEKNEATKSGWQGEGKMKKIPIIKRWAKEDDDDAKKGKKKKEKSKKPKSTFSPA